VRGVLDLSSNKPATHTIIKQGSNYVSSIGMRHPDAAKVMQRTIDSMQPGSVLTISAGNYQINSDRIFCPNVDNLTIQGVGDNTVLDATANPLNDNPTSSANANLAILGRINEDNTYQIGQKIINNLTIRNMRLIGNQTGPKYLVNNLNMCGIRADNVNNLLIENIHTNFTGTSIQSRNVNGGVIRGCKSYNDAAGPTITSNTPGPSAGTHNIVVENCYVYRSMDDSFAVLGAFGTGTTDIELRNCVADKGSEPDSSSPSIGASCYKLDGAGTGKVHDVKYLNCKAYNGKVGIGRPEIQGGFINGDPKVYNITFEDCVATNCKIGYELSGMNNSLKNCAATNCDTGILVTQNAAQTKIERINYSGTTHPTGGILRLSDGNYSFWDDKIKRWCDNLQN
jgi:hypothetical protein